MGKLMGVNDRHASLLSCSGCVIHHMLVYAAACQVLHPLPGSVSGVPQPRLPAANACAEHVHL